MPPRLDLFSALRLRAGTSCQASTIRPFSTTPSPCASTVAQKRRRQDPYALAQAKARRAANLSRQEVLRTERAKTYGDPIRGLTTPFLESFDTGLPPSEQRDGTDTAQYLNHYLNESELQDAIQHSNALTTPISRETPGLQDPLRRESQEQEHREAHANAREALSRIASLENSSSRDRTHANIQRCIATFGRHNTDKVLKPRPISTLVQEGHVQQTATPRAGPDTGSSEVQISILTAKIRALANFLDTRGRKDVTNKRNLRLLVHKRQKLLRYMRTKERGGERWQHLIRTLGLTEGTWKGEITL